MPGGRASCKPTVYLQAYVFGNLGDDLFIRLVCARYPEASFSLICREKFAKAFQDIPNLRCIHPSFFTKALRKLNVYRIPKSDFVVFVGGSIFMQSPNWRKLLARNRQLTRGKDAYVIGSNFGPFHSDEFYQSYRQLFSALKDICFRDRYSYDLFSALPNARYAPDIVLTGDVSARRNGKTERTAVISVIRLSHRQELARYAPAYDSAMTTITNCFTEHGYQVVLMGFCEAEGDAQTVQQLLSSGLIAHPALVRGHIYGGDVEESMSVLSGAECVVATRFHAMILGFLMYKPVFPIVYSDKTQHVLDDLRYSGPSCRVGDIHGLDAASVFRHLTSAKPLDIGAQAAQAQLQFAKLDEALPRRQQTKAESAE